MRDFFSEHALAGISAFVLALLLNLPPLLFPFMAGDAYRGINVGHWDDDVNYLTKGREILEGHPPGNIFLNIGKNFSPPDPHQVYVEYALMAPIKLLGLSRFAADHIVSLYVLYMFLGAAALVLLIYFFILHYSSHKLLSVTVALFTVGAYNLVKLSHIPMTAANPDPNMFSRPLLPLFGLLALFIYLNFLARCLQSPNPKRILFTGVTFGMLFYVYPYTWTFASAFTVVLFATYLVMWDRVRVKTVTVIAVIGFALGSYTIYKTLAFDSSEVGRFIMSYGVENTHTPMPISKLAVLVLLLTALAAYRNEDEAYPLLFATAIANFAVLNQQIITGRAPQPLHYFWSFVIPLSVVAGSYLAWSLVASFERGKALLRRYGTFLLIALMALSFGNTAWRQYRVALLTKDFKLYAQKYRPVIDWLRQDAAPGAILTFDTYYSKMLTVYTDHDLFWLTNSFPFNTPMRRHLDALYVYMSFDPKVKNDVVAEIRRIDQESRQLLKKKTPVSNIYTVLTTFAAGVDGVAYVTGRVSDDPAVIQASKTMMERVVREYKNMTSDPSGVVGLLKKNGVTYVLWDKEKDSDWDISTLSPHLQEIMTSDGLFLYRLL